MHLPIFKIIFPGIVILFDRNAISIAWYDILINIWRWDNYGFWDWNENVKPLVSD